MSPRLPLVPAVGVVPATGMREYANIVVVGGSYSGICVAHKLLSKTLNTMGKSLKYRVILISPSTHLYWDIAAPRAICDENLIPEEQIFLPFVSELRKYSRRKFKFIHGQATNVNFSQRTIEVRETDPPFGSSGVQTVAYHALILATGTSSHSDLLSLHGDYQNTAKAIRRFRRGLASASSLVIVGGGASGVECAGQIATWVNSKRWTSSSPSYHKLGSVSSARGSDISDDFPITIKLISGHRRLLPDLDPEIGAKAEKQLREIGVHVYHKIRLVSAQQLADGRTRCLYSNGMMETCDLSIQATGQTPNTDYLPREILDASSYVVVDPRLLRVPRAGERVYGIGSVCGSNQNNLEDIFRAIPVLTHNLRNDLIEFETKMRNAYGRRDEQTKAIKDIHFKPRRRVTQMCPLTRWGGVGLYNGHKLPSILVWLIKGRDYQASKGRSLVAKGRRPAFLK